MAMAEHFGAGWEGAMAIEYDEWTAARVLAHVDIDDRHHQPYGIVHGGVWSSIVESVASHGAAAAANELGGIAGVVGVSNLTDFLRSHERGRVDAIASPVFVGRTQQLWAVEVSRESDGKLVARGQVRFQNLVTLPADRSVAPGPADRDADAPEPDAVPGAEPEPPAEAG